MEFRLANPDDAAALARSVDVFDHPVDAALAAEFLTDPRHHLAIAIDGDGRVVGMASGVHYVHPDKAPELWVNEVGVAPSVQGQGIGRRVLGVLLDHGRALGCRDAWLLTDDANVAARRMYAAAGGRETPPQILITFDLQESGSREPAR